MNEVRRLSAARQRGPLVRAVMGPGVICPHDVGLDEVARLMEEHGAESVAIQGPSGRVIGLLSEWDLLRYFDAPPGRTAGEALHTPPHFIGPDEPAREALRRMHLAGVPHLIVTEDAGGRAARPEPLGMVSTRDLVACMAASGRTRRRDRNG